MHLQGAMIVFLACRQGSPTSKTCPQSGFFVSRPSAFTSIYVLPAQRLHFPPRSKSHHDCASSERDARMSHKVVASFPFPLITKRYLLCSKPSLYGWMGRRADPGYNRALQP